MGGHRRTANDGWRLVFVSENYPSYAIGTSGTSSAVISAHLGRVGVPEMALEFQTVPCDDCDAHPLIISNSAQKNLFFYENSWTGALYTTSSDPGKAGYWYMEPFI